MCVCSGGVSVVTAAKPFGIWYRWALELSQLLHNRYYSKAFVHVVNVYQHVALHECSWPPVIVLDCISIANAVLWHWEPIQGLSLRAASQQFRHEID